MEGQRSIEAIEVQNIRDEVFLSARGNPIGIRITFEARFPETVVGSLHASAFGPAAPYPLQFDQGHQSLIEPSPDSSEGGYKVFRQNTVYKFTETTLPNFLSYDERTQQPCLKAVTTNISEPELISIISNSRSTKYRTAILSGSDFSPTSNLVQTYVTSREYDFKAMYESIVREGNRHCGS